MGTNFLVILTLLFLQGFGLSNNMLMTSSNVTCIERERQSLLEIKHSLKDKYNLLSTWSGVECCVWQGVECDSRSGHVVKLDLRSQVYVEMITPIDKCLEGDLSPSLQNLKHLHYLDLSMNNFSGNIPEFFGSLKFQRLEYLNLSGSFSAGVVPHHLGNLSRLQYLDLSYYFVNTRMTLVYTRTPILDDLGWLSSLSSLRYLGLSGISIGEYHDWFHSLNKLPSLRTLNLGECGITNIPSVKFVNYTSLNSLDLSSNEISSTIPVWLSNLTGLMHLNLCANYFHGIIPDFIGMFSDVSTIDLSINSLETLMPDLLRNLSSLVHLDLSYNMVSCPIPQTVGLLLRLEDLNLRGNQLSGNIPTSLWQLSKLKNLDLSYNSLAGVLSESYFTKLKNLNNLGLSGNWLALNFSSGWIPPFQLQIFGASSCNIGPNFPNWLQTQTYLQSLVLSNSSIKDTIPEWFENIMSHIFELDLSNN